MWNNAAFLLQQAIVSNTMQVEEREHCGKAEAGMRDKRKILGSRLVILFYIFFSFTFWFNFTSAKSPSYRAHSYFRRITDYFRSK